LHSDEATNYSSSCEIYQTLLEEVPAQLTNDLREQLSVEQSISVRPPPRSCQKAPYSSLLKSHLVCESLGQLAPILCVLPHEGESSFRHLFYSLMLHAVRVFLRCNNTFEGFY
jgi:hypothetical protein